MSIQLKHGAYYVVITYRDDFNKKHNKWIKVGTSIKQAEKMERQLRSDYENGSIMITANSGMTVKVYLEKWLDEVIKPTKAPATYANYYNAIRSTAKILGEIQLSKLTSAMVRKWISKELQTLKPTTVNNHFFVLSSALDVAITEYKILKSNPCKPVKSPGTNTPKNGAYTVEQTQMVLDIMQHTNVYICVLLGALVGLRRGEICGLRWQDINLDKNIAHITHNLDRVPIDWAKSLPPGDTKYIPLWNSIKTCKAKTVLCLGPVKTPKSEQAVVLPALVVKELKELLLAQKWHKQQLGPSYSDSDIICCWEDGRPFDPDYFYYKFTRELKAYNESEAGKRNPIPVLRVHDLRHTQATLLLRSKVDLKVVSRTLRHKRASFTQDVYQHVLEDMMTEPASIMDDIFRSAK